MTRTPQRAVRRPLTLETLLDAEVSALDGVMAEVRRRGS
jgi:hypothetical protein